MEIQIRTTELTEEQEALERAYHEAANVLRLAGFKATVNRVFAHDPWDDPCCIYLERGAGVLAQLRMLGKR